jgi:DNA polymerase-4
MKDRGDTKSWDPAHRIIAHIDMDAFYAAIEVLDDPALRGKPVIVGGDSRRGVVSAASYEARKFGVHSAMPVFQAKRLCPQGIFLPGRMGRYREISRVVMGCLREFSPLVEQVSVDEAYIDLTGTEKLFGSPAETAAAIKKRIRDETALTCSIGVSTSKLLSKIASDLDKPDGITIITPGEAGEFLAALPIGKIPGIGGRSGEALARIGIKRVGDIGRYPEKWMRDKFGKFGDWLLDVARGTGGPPVVPYTQPKSLSTELTLPEDTSDRGVLKKHLLHQSERVARRLRKHGFKGRTVTLKIKHSNFRQFTRSVTLEKPTCTGKVIYAEAAKLLDAHDLRTEARLIGVGVSNLEAADPGGQLSLFRESDPDEDKWEKAEKAVDEILRRFGDGKVKRGRLLE